MTPAGDQRTLVGHMHVIRPYLPMSGLRVDDGCRASTLIRPTRLRTSRVRKGGEAVPGSERAKCELRASQSLVQRHPTSSRPRPRPVQCHASDVYGRAQCGATQDANGSGPASGERADP